jgi:arylsulfatase A-like enzyme
MVGDLRTASQERARPTVWFFMSDNGMAWGRDGIIDKGAPMADQLPFYAAGAGLIHGATSALVSNIDIGPTIASLAGTTMPLADGVSFAAVLSGGIGGRTRLLEDFPVAYGPAGPWAGVWWGVRTPIWHLVKYKGTGAWLYDLRVDPWETTNVRMAHPKVVRRLKRYAAPFLY